MTQKKIKDLSLKSDQADREALATEIARHIEPHVPAILNALQQIGSWLVEVSEKLGPILNKLSLVDFAELEKTLLDAPQRSKMAMESACKQGWFFNWLDSLEEVLILEGKILAAGSTEEIDTLMLEHYRANWEFYRASLAEKYPTRIQPIEAAIAAHLDMGKNGYFLSIPVFLAQADGIFSEMTGIPSAMDKLRMRATGVQGLKGIPWVEEKIGEDEEAKALLAAIFQLHSLDIFKSVAERALARSESGKEFNALNRHQVMHGEVSDYGTEANSAKAFSFLVFISLHLPAIIESISSLPGPPKRSPDATQ